MPYRIPLLFLFLSAAPAAAAPAAAAPLYAVADRPVPVLNTPDISRAFSGDHGGPILDRCGQMRSMEFVALPDTAFEVEEAGPEGTALRVTTSDYPYPSTGGYYVDARLVRLQDAPPPQRKPSLPSREKVLAALKEAEGAPYVWGGDVRHGIADLAALYPTDQKLSPEQRQRKILAGVDCSGLLYEATGGWTPRNTSALTRFGTKVPAAGLTAEELARRLQPLDLIVWQGHVVIVIDGGRVIESRLSCEAPGRGGVRISPLAPYLERLMNTRKPADRLPEGKQKEGYFVVRRWYPDQTISR